MQVGIGSSVVVVASRKCFTKAVGFADVSMYFAKAKSSIYPGDFQRFKVGCSTKCVDWRREQLIGNKHPWIKLNPTAG